MQEISVKYPPNNQLSNKSMKNYPNIITGIKSSGLLEDGGEVSVCSCPAFTDP